MTKELPTWKDRFDIEFSNRGFAPGSKEQYLAFIEQEIIEAERRGREEMRKECLKCTQGYTVARTAISSLK